MIRRYTPAEDAQIRALYAQPGPPHARRRGAARTASDLAAALGRSRVSIQERARALGLTPGRGEPAGDLDRLLARLAAAIRARAAVQATLDAVRAEVGA